MDSGAEPPTRGSVSSNNVPVPGAGAHDSVPACRLTISALMNNPSPDPGIPADPRAR